MKQLTIRGVSSDLAQAIDGERRRRGVSLNQTLLDLLSQALNVSTGKSAGNGLKDLAGTWSAEELLDFENNTRTFEQIDEELWS